MWTYQGEPFTSADIGDYAGFVYTITDLENGMRYIGKKTFWFKSTLSPLKGQTRKRKKVVESDWQDYFGSNKTIQQLVAEHGRERFSREILHLCRSSSEMSYLEAKLQFEHDVLLDDSFFNDYIQVRVAGKHVRALKVGVDREGLGKAD
ncbi:hypothetical protein [Rhizobium sp.]|uniref:hypothetical protein n=1 Tax=Rhizobium sp. TaxID=391 RepID=UPI0028A9EFFA